MNIRLGLAPTVGRVASGWLAMSVLAASAAGTDKVAMPSTTAATMARKAGLGARSGCVGA